MTMNGQKTNDRRPLIEAVNLRKYFKKPGKKTLHAVDDINFNVYSGETLGLVGESGCGKSTVGNVIMRLMPHTDGKLLYNGEDIFHVDHTRGQELRKKMQIIFQDPFSSLNPKKTIKTILSEAYQIHRIGNSLEISRRVNELCERVELQSNLLNHYPHELDGGMRQVVGIARALSLNPNFIVCDEPVSSLDVSVQAKIINMLMSLQKEMGLSYLFISHDLSVVRHISSRVAVMYLGQIIEIAETDELFTNTRHPYSIALLSAVPRVNADNQVARIVLKGDVPSPIDPKPGCRFAPRCWMPSENCFQEASPLVEITKGHSVACYYSGESRERAKSAETQSISGF